jgi:hypothetical protein
MAKQIESAALTPIVRVGAEWVEVTASFPASALAAYDDLRALRVNSSLSGPTRVARQFGEREPHLRAEMPAAQVSDVSTFVEVARASATAAVDRFASAKGRHLPSGTPPSIADVERACRELGWNPISADSGVRVGLMTRAGVFNARLDGSVDPHCFFVELLELSNRSDDSCRAVAALLMAASSSFRLVKGGIVERDGVSAAALMATLPDASEPAVDSALSALAAAVQASAREVEALLDAKVATEYVALSLGGRETTSDSLMEEACLQ